MSCKVSLIIPVYNVEPYIRESLSSALEQTFDSIEYIIVDDCGTDNSIAIVEDIVSRHRRKDCIKIIKHESNKGLSAARNTGLENATGDYVYFMDSDDEITPDCIERHYNAVVANNAHFSIANIELEGARSVHIKDFSNDCTDKSLLSSFFLRKWNVSACNKLYDRDFLLNNNLSFQKGLLQEDILWSYKLCLHADRAAWIKERTYIYKVRENSITHSKVSSHKIESMIFILNSIIDDIENETISHKYEKEVAYMINFYRLNTALLLLNYDGSNAEAKSYYKHLTTGRLASLPSFSPQSMVLKLPFSLFRLFVSPLYFLYKK